MRSDYSYESLPGLVFETVKKHKKIPLKSIKNDLQKWPKNEKIVLKNKKKGSYSIIELILYLFKFYVWISAR